MFFIVYNFAVFFKSVKNQNFAIFKRRIFSIIEVNLLWVKVIPFVCRIFYRIQNFADSKFRLAQKSPNLKLCLILTLTLIITKVHFQQPYKFIQKMITKNTTVQGIRSRALIFKIFWLNIRFFILWFWGVGKNTPPTPKNYMGKNLCIYAKSGKIPKFAILLNLSTFYANIRQRLI